MPLDEDWMDHQMDTASIESIKWLARHFIQKGNVNLMVALMEQQASSFEEQFNVKSTNLALHGGMPLAKSKVICYGPATLNMPHAVFN